MGIGVGAGTAVCSATDVGETSTVGSNSADPVGAGVGVNISSVTATRGRTGSAVGDGASVTSVPVAAVGGRRVAGFGVTNPAVPVGALTKILVRPGSAAVQPTASAIRERTTNANGYPCLAPNRLL